MHICACRLQRKHEYLLGTPPRLINNLTSLSKNVAGLTREKKKPSGDYTFIRDFTCFMLKMKNGINSL